jgi:hypothetical protein
MARGLLDFQDPQLMGLLGISSGLLQAGGPSRMPVSVGQGIGMGLNQGMKFAEDASQMQNRNRALDQRDELMRLKNDALMRGVPQQQQFAPSSLGKLFAERAALPPGTPQAVLDAYDKAIKNFSESQDRNPSYQFIQGAQGLVRGDRRSGDVSLANLPGGAPIIPPSASPVLQGQIAGSRATAQADAAARSVSPRAQGEIIETEEQIQGAQSALELLGQARAINDKAMGFRGAGALSEIGTLLPDAIRPESVDATQNLDNILQSSALPQLKAIFGGMPTEGERKILLDIQGSSSKPPKVRADIFKRAEEAINRRIKFNQEKASALRGGTYFTGAAPESITAPQRRKDDESNDPLGIRKK